MKLLRNTPLLFAIAVTATHVLTADATAQTNSGGPSTAAASQTNTTPKLSQEELEAKFKAMLNNASMSGRWCSVKDGVLGPEKEDKYNIVGADKLSGDNWIVRAKIQFGQREIVAPIPVKIRWAGDTAVLSVDNLSMPGPGGASGTAYTARVMFFDNTYSGRWSGGDHGGMLCGTIAPAKVDAAPAR